MKDPIAKGFRFGHPIYCSRDDYTMKDGSCYYENWRFVESDKLIVDVDRSTLICPECGKTPTDKEHDPCIADLPGVKFACCGHGTKQPYICYESGEVYRGKKAEREFKKLRETTT